MPGSEEFVQSAVHALEAGGLVVWVKRGAVALGIQRNQVLGKFPLKWNMVALGFEMNAFP